MDPLSLQWSRSMETRFVRGIRLGNLPMKFLLPLMMISSTRSSPSTMPDSTPDHSRRARSSVFQFTLYLESHCTPPPLSNISVSTFLSEGFFDFVCENTTIKAPIARTAHVAAILIIISVSMSTIFKTLSFLLPERVLIRNKD